MHASCAPTRARPALELADVVRAHGKAFLERHALRPEQRAALRAIEQCRTPALGGHLDVCGACGYERPSYNSCRNRHCPKCQSLAQARWIEGRLGRLLPVHYFHVVFTLPSELRALVQRSGEKLFDMLFASAAQTLLTLARDPKRLGAELGVTMVLHTWTRELLFRRPSRYPTLTLESCKPRDPKGGAHNAALCDPLTRATRRTGGATAPSSALVLCRLRVVFLVFSG